MDVLLYVRLSHFLRVVISMTVNTKDIEAELSYAYLHAVASHAGFTCSYSSRLEDARGVDARVGVGAKLDPKSILEDFEIDVQLKATAQQLSVVDNKFSFFFKGIKQYDKLRSEKNGNTKLLILMCLPEDRSDWVSVTPNELLLKNAAYWISLRGAPESQNTTGATVYFPSSNVLTVDALKSLMTLISKGEVVRYEP
jgi:hypothetical protein